MFLHPGDFPIKILNNDMHKVYLNTVKLSYSSTCHH